ncbi:hypothetical protein AcW2_007031 [Taiwanofungus camphoratus]|nr:hypothetical protein AcW2_007031 [Antrodia cinnamomea]
METYHYSHFPAEVACVYITLFTNVSNASQLRSRIIRASLMQGDEGDLEREAVNFAFIDARLICSVLHLQTAIIQAILAHSQGSLRTKTVHSEVLWALSPSNNITEAIKRFGVSDSATSLFVVRIGSQGLNDVQDRMKAVVSGDLSTTDVLSHITDWGSIKKFYKLNNEQSLKAVGRDVTQEQMIIDEIVVSSVAMKSVMQ